MRPIPRPVAIGIALLVLCSFAALIGGAGYGIYQIGAIALGIIGVAAILVGLVLLLIGLDGKRHQQRQFAIAEAYEKRLQQTPAPPAAYTELPAPTPTYAMTSIYPEWGVRKTPDGHYVVLPIDDGEPRWTAALNTLFENNYDGMIAAWDLAVATTKQASIEQAESTQVNLRVNAGSTWANGAFDNRANPLKSPPI
jgi:hypothetical protein